MAPIAKDRKPLPEPAPELIGLATRELDRIGLLNRQDGEDGCVVRQSKAYPVCDDGYRWSVDTFVAELQRGYPGLHLARRNGMHKYNIQDHAMMTALLTARSIVAGQRLYDVWRVNQNAEYHESGLRMIPARVREG